jgi:hypothetical protein
LDVMAAVDNPLFMVTGPENTALLPVNVLLIVATPVAIMFPQFTWPEPAVMLLFCVLMVAHVTEPHPTFPAVIELPFVFRAVQLIVPALIGPVVVIAPAPAVIL